MLQDIFSTTRPVIGVIHLLPLPGSHRWDGDLESVCRRAEQEAAALATGGVDAIILENFFDAPFTRDRVDPACACAMTACALRVRAISDLSLGINVLRNDALTATAVAVACGAQFIRVNVLSGAMVTDQGIIQSCAHELMAYRKALAATQIKILADVMVKHAWPLGTGSSIEHAAVDTVKRSGADAIIVSGTATGQEPALEDLSAVRQAVGDVPIFVGSGTTVANCASLLAHADGVIVASSLKRQGLVENPIDVERVRQVVNAVKNAAPSAKP